MKARGKPRTATWILSLCLLVTAGAPAARALAPASAGTPASHAAAARAAQAAPTPQTEEGSKQGLDPSEISIWLKPLARLLHVSTDVLWMVVVWINFGILAYLLYYLLCRLKGWKLGGKMRERNQFVRRKLAEAREAKSEAEERLRSIERRLDKLHEEVAQLRAEAAQEAEVEFQRLSAESAAEADKIARTAAQHIDAAGKAARQELRRFTAELALNMAERQLRRQLTPEIDQRVVRTSLEEIRDGRPPRPAGNKGTHVAD